MSVSRADATESVTSPLFSVVTPVFDPPIAVLRDAIDSVLAQTYDDWELILVDDRSTDDEVRRTLHEYARRDARVTVIERPSNGHIVAASNDGLDAAVGEFVVLLDHDDVLVPSALEHNARIIRDDPTVDYVYSDEDLIAPDGRRDNAFVKPDWSPERLRGQNYCCHLSVLRASLVREVGGFRPGFEGSQDHDLILRVTERARRVAHIPEVLYHWRVTPGSAAADPDAKPYAVEAGRRAVQDHLDRQGIDGEVSVGTHGRYVISRRLPPERRVSIVIPTIGSGGLIWGEQRCFVTEAVRSALARTEHQDLEVVVVYDAPTPAAVLDELRAIAGDRLVLVRFDEPFNYSRKMNLGVLASTGDRLILLNDDVEVRSERWVEELLAPLEEPDVGATGAKLYFSDTTLQHAGIAASNGQFRHPYRRSLEDTPGKAGMLLINREVSGVTGACLGIRRDLFLELGGLCEQLPHSFNDVDFSYKVRASGHRIVVLASCELFHFESQTREPVRRPWEMKFMRSRWGVAGRDAYTPEYPDMPPPRGAAPAKPAAQDATAPA
jgi:O-antigen biosynthesis protein